MKTYRMKLIGGHLFITINNQDWFFDTGAHISCGIIPSIVVAGQEFKIPDNLAGILTPETLSRYVNHETTGLIGADIFSKFDMIIDVPKGCITFADTELDCDGNIIETGDLMGTGCPTLQVVINGTTYPMIFDTGAQISYFLKDVITLFPSAGIFADFDPFSGGQQFQVKTYSVNLTLGNLNYTLQCGDKFPEGSMLGNGMKKLKMDGLIGNEILRNRITGFFPRRRQLVLGCATTCQP